MNKTELIRNLCGAAFQDGCTFALECVSEICIDYVCRNLNTVQGRVVGKMADQLQDPSVMKAFEDMAMEYGEAIVAKIKEYGAKDAKTESV